ncbi:MAG: NAD-dependent epimerase/dehydratase [Alphaproteobacteria bacterium]|nr:NAD-dependent epimerase/dehydratase [Alphaproteobacteria bacterium]MBM3652056.1 NAD-dependent epimerase/dehydratase [Alphaproteobacteria bacterium]
MLQHLAPATAKPLRVVVLGAGGFVGAAVCRRLADAGVKTLPVTRADCDLLMPDATQRIASLLCDGDAIVAASAIAPCKNIDMLIDNMRLTRTLVAAIGRVNASHVVNISSDAVYGDDQVPLTESTPAAPASFHGVMHLAREIAFQSDIKAPLAILRPTLIYGADDRHNGYGPNRFQRLAAKGEDIMLFGAGEERRDHVWIEDVAEIISRVLLRRSTGVLNVASGAVHSFRAVADFVVSASSRKVAIKDMPRSGPMPHNGYRPFDVAATRAAFPDFHYTQLADGLKKAQRAEGP